MSEFFDTILIQPLFNILVAIHNTIPGNDMGVAILILTILVRSIFVPLTIKSSIAQQEMAAIQPKIKELEKKFKDNKAGLAQAQIALYKEQNINPFSGCLPLLIQLPVILALYHVFVAGLDSARLSTLYSFVSNPGSINEIAFGFLNLTVNAPILAIIASGLQAIQGRIVMKSQKRAMAGQDNPALKMSQQMLYFFPLIMLAITWNLPSGLVLYFIMTTLFSIFEQLFIRHRYTEHRTQSTEHPNS